MALGPIHEGVTWSPQNGVAIDARRNEDEADEEEAYEQDTPLSRHIRMQRDQNDRRRKNKSKGSTSRRAVLAAPAIICSIIVIGCVGGIFLFQGAKKTNREQIAENQSTDGITTNPGTMSRGTDYDESNSPIADICSLEYINGYSDEACRQACQVAACCFVEHITCSLPNEGFCRARAPCAVLLNASIGSYYARSPVQEETNVGPADDDETHDDRYTIKAAYDVDRDQLTSQQGELSSFVPPNENGDGNSSQETPAEKANSTKPIQVAEMRSAAGGRFCASIGYDAKGEELESCTDLSCTTHYECGLVTEGTHPFCSETCSSSESKVQMKEDPKAPPKPSYCAEVIGEEGKKIGHFICLRYFECTTDDDCPDRTSCLSDCGRVVEGMGGL